LAERPKISVIIPAYNRAQTLARAVQSVLNQGIQDLEILLVDDGSTDGTPGVMESFQDPRIVRISHPRNLGAAAARNSGLRKARGDYVAFLDSDDEWLPEKLDRQLELLERLPRRWALSCTAFYLVEEVGQTLVCCPPKDLSRQLLETCDYSPGSTLVLRRDCLSSVGELDEGLERLEDWDWLLRLARYYCMAYLERPLAKIYKKGIPSASATERATLRFLHKHKDEIERYGPRQSRKIYSRHYLRLAHYLYMEGDVKKGTSYLLKAVLERPVQNPLRFLGVLQSLMDGMLGTRISTRMIHLKRKYLSGGSRVNL